MKRSKLLLILALVVVLALGVLVSCNKECAHETYGAWKLTKAPTLTEDGEAVRLCADCGVADVATVAKLSDTTVWTPTSTSATHESAGKTTYTSDYGTVEITVDRLTAHVYDKEVAEPQFLASAADCTHAATYRKSCSCGAVDTATFTSGNPLGHDAKSVPEVPAVHTQSAVSNGVAAHHKCDRCGKLFTDATCTTETNMDELTVVAAHNYGAWTFVSAPTCTEAGSQTRECATCHKVDVATTPALGHDYTSGKMVLVTERDSYQDDDGSVVEGDEKATEFHAPVCDVCGFVNKEEKVSHSYGEWEFVIEEDHNGHEVHKQHVCDVCDYKQYEMQGENVKSYGYLEHSWTVGEMVKPTYTSDGYTEYTSTYGTVRLVLPKLIAPYEGKTYMPIEVERKSGFISGVAQYTLWDHATINVDDKGHAKGTASPFMGDVVITMVNAETGEITLTVTDRSSKYVYEGYVEPLTGVMVISDDGYDSVYIVSPYEMTRESTSASYWLGAIAITYHIDCGTYTGHDINILVHDDVVTFDVSFATEQGAPVAANECFSQDTLIVTATDGSVVATYVRNSDGALQEADQYRGEYKALMDIDSETDVEVGTLIIDGIGGFVLDDGEDTLSGTYQAIYDAQNKLTHFDAYVIVGGKKVAYYHASINVENKAIKLVPQVVNVTWNIDSSKGTLGDESDIFVGCANVLPEVTAANGYSFIGWYTKDGTGDDWGEQVTAETVFDGTAITLYARLTLSVTVNFSGVLSGDATSHVYGDGELIANGLPKYVVNETADTDSNSYFAGWYTDAEFANALASDAIVSSASIGATVYAKWVKGGAWTAFHGDDSFVYNSATNTWKTTNFGHTTFAKFYAIGGDIVVKFDYYFGNIVDNLSFGSEYYDTLTITNDTTKLVNELKNTNSSAPLIGSKQTISVVVKNGTYLEIKAKYQSGRDDTCGVFIANLTVNGRSIDYQGTESLNEGTYTCEDQPDLVITDREHFTMGDVSGTYELKNFNSASVIILTALDGDKTVGQYNVTLTDSTYVATQVTVDVKVFYGLSGSSSSSYGKLGQETIPVAKYSKYVLPTEGEFVTKTDSDGKEYKFIGWFTSATGSTVVSTVDTTKGGIFYARYVLSTDAATLTYDYLTGGLTHSEFVSTKANLPALHQMPDSVKVEGKMFAGWYRKDGTQTGDWGDMLAVNDYASRITEDTTVYAKWVVPHALMGIYKTSSNNGYSSMDSASITEIDCDGRVVRCSNTTLTGSVLAREANADGSWTFTKGSSTYYAWIDNGVIVVTALSNKTGFEFSQWSPLVILVKVDSENISVAFNAKVYISDVANLVFTVDVGSGDAAVRTWYYVDSKKFYTNVTLTAVTKDGTPDATLSKLTTSGTVTTISYNNEVLSTVAYYSSKFQQCDGTQGKYVNGEDFIWLDGIGNVYSSSGSADTLKAVSGKDNTYNVTNSSKNIDITIDVTNKTYTVTENKVTVSYNFGELSATLAPQSIYANVWTDLPTTGPAITGYVFRGWYLTSDFTGSAQERVKYTEDTTIYAKYDKAITVTLIYGNGMTDGSVTDKFANDKVTVELPAIKDGKAAEGWYTTSTFDEGTKWSSGSVVTDDLTLYCKWVTPHALMGVYKGYESYYASTTSSKNMTIDVSGNVDWTKASGLIEDYNPQTGTFVINSNGTKRYAYYDAFSHTIVTIDSAGTELSADVHILTKVDNANVNVSIASSASAKVAKWDDNKSQLIQFTVGGTLRTFLVYGNKVYGDVVVLINGASVTNLSTVKVTGNVLTVTQNSVEVFKGVWDGTAFAGSDGKQGTYTGTIGTASSIVVDGYGSVTIGDDTVAYTLDGNKITFALNNRTMVVELGDGTCAQVQDGYAGEYTMPDGTTKITLDGLGGAGDGATYVVNGAAITIYSGDDSATYGLDVANKVLLGKSIFAGLTFSGSTPETNISYGTSLKLIFNEAGPIAGSFVADKTYAFVGTYDESTQVLTIVLDNAAKTTITAKVANKKLTFTSDFVVSNVDHIKDVEMTCNDFTLPA